MKLLSFISENLLLCVFLSLLWGTTDSTGIINATQEKTTTTQTAQAITTTTQKTATKLLTSTTQSSTSLTPTITKSAPEIVQNVTVKMRNETSITLQWKKVSNTDTYILEFNQRNITITASEENMTYTVLNLTDGTRYNFSLFTVFKNVRSSGVNHIAVTAPRSVKVVTVVGQNETSIRLKWDKVNNIATYILQYNYNGSVIGKNINVSQEGPIEYVVTPLTAATNYSFTLFTVLGGVNSSGHRFSAVTAPSNAVEFRSLYQHETSITLQWKKVSNIDTYILEFNQRSITITASAENMTYTVLNLTDGTRYNFSLFAVFKNVRSSGVNHIAVTAPRNVKVVTVVGQNERSIRLKWDKVNNIATYILQYNYNGSVIGKNINVSREGPIEYVVTPLAAATKYSFTLFSVFEGVKSSGHRFSDVTVPENVQNVSVTAQNETSIRLKWDKVNNIATYILQYNYNGSAIEKNINVSQEGPIEYLVSPLTAATNYSFTLFTVLEGVKSSGYTFNAVTAPSNAVEFRSLYQNETSITLQWKRVSNTDTYILEFNQRSITITASEENMTYTVLNLTDGTRYNFSLFTVFKNIRSSGVNHIAVTAPRSVNGVTVVGQNETSIKLKWEKVNNIATYILNYKYSGSATEMNISLSQEEPTEYVVSPLTAGTNYSFTLFTVFEGVRSTGYTFPAVTAPLNTKKLKTLDQNETSITLEWEKVPNVNMYTLVFNETELNITSAEVVTYSVGNLISGSRYNFSLFTVFGNVRSSGVNHLAVTAPKNVQNVTLVAQTNSSITLNWSKINNISEYILKYDKEYRINETQNDTIVHVVTPLTAGTKYNFTLFTVFEGVNSSGYTFNAVTVPPMVSSVSVTERFTNNITLNWENMNKDWEYLLLISGNVSDSKDNSSNTVTKVVTALKPGTEYNFTLITMFSGLNSAAYSNFTVTAIDCASADWTATNASIKGKIKGLFSIATASNGSQISVRPEGEYVSFTGLYPGATYEISLVYEKSSRRFQQCHHKVTVLPPNLNAHCEYWAAGYSVLIAWNEPDGEWTAVEVNVSEKSLTKNRSEKKVAIAGFQPAKKYQVSVTSLSGPDGTVRSSEPHVFKCETDPRGVIAGSVFAVLLFGLLVALVVFIFLKRPHFINRKKSFIGGAKVSKTRSVAISAAKFPAHFHQLSLDENRGFSEEYEDLAPVGREQTQKIAILPENKAKNRFTNVLPYDWCRVKLSTQDPNGTSDYINANYMPGYRSTREYIATQGPLPSTVNDFWRMIWEQRVKRIVMVTNCIEGGRTKCEQYWPADRKPSFHGDLQVTVRSEQPEPSWTLREFSLKDRKTSEERRVKHFHFTAWPDHGVPQGTEILIQFRGLVRQHIERERSDAPTVIHCSAGVGRTGTIIALDVLLQQLEKEQAVGINSFVRKMRLNRPYMVQTESQYIFLHQCIMDTLQPKGMNEENVYENADMIYVNATALHELRRHNANA